MIRSEKPNIFNISSQQNFFESLCEWISKKFSEEISDVKIFLPNHRSCREFQEIFLRKNLNKSVILPNIRAISDISYEDFFDFRLNDEIKQIIDELMQIKLITGIDYLFFLSQKIQNLELFGNNIQANQSLNIATQLENLFDEIEKDEINLDKLNEIDDSDLSAHRQVTLEFLRNFHVKIKNSLIKNNILFASSYQNFIINKFIESLEKYGSKFPLIIAGSTGSVSAGKKLIKAISKQDNGYVILHGVQQEIEKIDQEYHPQFLLNELLKFLEIESNKIKNIQYDNLQLSPKDRLKFISTSMLQNEESIKWQNLDSLFSIKNTIQDFEKNFKIIQTKDELEEARIIALMVSEASGKNKKCAVITNNQKLSQFLKYELTNLSLDFNDSRNIGIADSELMNFILLILEMLESDFASYELLALFKNSLFVNNEHDLIVNFEVNILRKERKNTGLIGIEKKLQLLKDDDLNKFFTKFCNNLSAIRDLPNSINIASYLKSLIKVVENLTSQKWQALLEKENAQIELFEFFEKIKSQDSFIIDAKNPLQTFKILFAKIKYFERSDSLSQIQILSTIEARLINRDLVIISSLNEGDFPEIESENWLGKKIRKELGVDKKLKKIGQNAYDFCNYLCNESVILTRSLTRNGSPSICSPFLLKFETLCKKLDLTLDKGEKYFKLLRKLELIELKKITRPIPKPGIEFRPKSLAVTDISKLRNDPYSIYAKKILRLKELKKIDFEPSHAEFGSFVHKALEEFIKSPKESENFLKKAYKIFEEYFISTQAKLVWWPKFENIFDGFLDQETKFKDLFNYTEIPAKLVINEILINGKIDRVSFDGNGLTSIFDYKTGQASSTKDVISGKEPQLTIAALILVEGALDNELSDIDIDMNQITSLNYWKLSASSKNEIKEVCRNNEEAQILMMAAKAGLEKLFEYFSNEENEYISAPNLQNYRVNEYSHLSRIKEWS